MKNKAPAGETPAEAVERWDTIYWKRLNLLNWIAGGFFLLAIGALLLHWLAIAVILLGLGAVAFVVLIPGPFQALKQKKKYRKLQSMIPR